MNDDLIRRLRTFIRDDRAVERPRMKALLLEAAAALESAAVWPPSTAQVQGVRYYADDDLDGTPPAGAAGGPPVDLAADTFKVALVSSGSGTRAPEKATTAEQQARDLLERMDLNDGEEFSAGDVVELANLIEERDRLKAALDFIGTCAASRGGELYPVGASDVEFGPDGNTVIRYVPPWHFAYSQGATFLEAVEAQMLRERDQS